MLAIKPKSLTCIKRFLLQIETTAVALKNTTAPTRDRSILIAASTPKSRLGFDTHWPIHQSLTGQAEVIRLFFQFALLYIGSGRKVFFPFDHLHDAGTTLTIAAAVRQLAHEGININVILQGFEPEIGTIGRNHFPVFVDELNYSHDHTLQSDSTLPNPSPFA
jgi:hypothetical protein